VPSSTSSEAATARKEISSKIFTSLLRIYLCDSMAASSGAGTGREGDAACGPHQRSHQKQRSLYLRGARGDPAKRCHRSQGITPVNWLFSRISEYNSDNLRWNGSYQFIAIN
jgi:hypothetical protein